MSLITLPYIFSSGATIIASQHNSNFMTVYNAVNGNLDNTNISPTAGIIGSQLNLSSPGAIGATTPSTGNFTTLTLSSTLNLGSTHQGDILYDNGTSIVRLTPGTNGQFLQTQGASANPQWANVTWCPNNIQVFTTSGTWTQPMGVTKVYVKVIGAGGAGGVNSNSGGAGGGGGGGGGYAEGIISVTGNVTVTIGSTNSFAGTTTIQATAGAAGSSTTSATPVAGGAGGIGSNGTINLTGVVGGHSTTTVGGNGGGASIGAGGQGANVTNGNGINGGSYGGGGGGAVGSGSAGTGDAGAVIVYY